MKNIGKSGFFVFLLTAFWATGSDAVIKTSTITIGAPATNQSSANQTSPSQNSPSQGASDTSSTVNPVNHLTLNPTSTYGGSNVPVTTPANTAPTVTIGPNTNPPTTTTTTVSTPVAPPAHPYTLPADWAAAQWTTAYAGTPLDITSYRLAFSDNFATCDITKEVWQATDPTHKWFAADGPFGSNPVGNFVSPQGAVAAGVPNPFDCSQGHLTITMSNPTQTATGWQGGEIATRSFGGAGFMQLYGYWEIEAMFPPLPDGFLPWMSFWMRDRLNSYPNPQTNEFDIFESGMTANAPLAESTTIHRWPANPALATCDPNMGCITAHVQKSENWVYNIFDGQHHTYGLKRTHDWQIVYVDRLERFRFPMTADDMRTPDTLLIDTAIMHAPTAPLSTTYTMHVYGVNIYSCPVTSAALGCTQ